MGRAAPADLTSPARPALQLGAALALLAALAAFTVARNRPPPVRGAEAPAADFSAVRAGEALRALARAGDGAPRPVGSEADRRTVEALLARFRALGLEAEVHRTFACGPYGSCAHVRNVVARLGAGAAQAVVLVAHHDSVAAGPGVADDLSGVAVLLEVARALASGPPLPRPFVALVTDAEESGLVGAAAFAREHPLARAAGAVVNLEARGTSGPSLVFETTGEPEWAVRVLGRMPRPLTTSIASAVYDVLPNDTDLTVLGREGRPGLNLAFAFDVPRYHTPLDDLAHLDPRSLQHQGENALALVRAIAGEDLEAGRRAPAIFFDVFGLGVLGYRHPGLVAGLAALLASLAALRVLGRTPRPLRSLLLGLAAALGAPLAAAAAMLLASFALRHAGALPRPFVASPAPFSAAAWALGSAALLAAAGAAGARARPAGLLAAATLLHAVLGLVLAAVLPGASHAFALPALASAVPALVAWRGSEAGGPILPSALAGGVAAAVVLFPVAYLLPPMLGVQGAVASAAVIALALLPLSPLAAAVPGRGRFRPALAGLAAAIVLCGVQATLPHATEDSPERASISFLEEDGRARWLVEAEREALPPGLAAAAAFSAERTSPFPGSPHRRAFAAPAPPAGLAPPRLEVLEERREGDTRRVRARLTSPRGAPVAALVFPPDAEVSALTMEGIEVLPPSGKVRRPGAARVHACAALPPEGVEIEVALRGDAKVPLVVLDESPGLPAGGERLRRARPRTAVPSREGDATYVAVRRVL